MLRLRRASLIGILGPLLMLTVPGGDPSAQAQGAVGDCPGASARAAINDPVAAPSLSPPDLPSGVRSSGNAPLPDYRERLTATAYGWPRLDAWCVWIEPLTQPAAGSFWEQRWLGAVEAALERWQRVLPIRRVNDPEAAQVRLLRQRPPLRQEADGRMRASHGRAILTISKVTRNGIALLEPNVVVLISPGQRPQAIQATALHELGHAFGLWGHSDRSDDAMAASPGVDPILELTPRDRATLQWLYGQPTRFGRPLDP